MKINVTNILLVAVVLLLLYVLFFSSPKVVHNRTIKEIETRVIDNTNHADIIKERVSRVDLSHLENSIDSLINLRKTEKDTVTIIKIQDSIIYKQVIVIDTLKIGIIDRDSIIAIQDTTLLQKDTIIQLKDKKIKKKNKDIIKLMLAALGTSIIAIFK